MPTDWTDAWSCTGTWTETYADSKRRPTTSARATVEAVDQPAAAAEVDAFLPQAAAPVEAAPALPARPPAPHPSVVMYSQEQARTNAFLMMVSVALLCLVAQVHDLKQEVRRLTRSPPRYM